MSLSPGKWSIRGGERAISLETRWAVCGTNMQGVFYPVSTEMRELILKVNMIKLGSLVIL